MTIKFFITGMFRSGTTLLARMLHTHKNIVCASDPYRPFFNYFRYHLTQNLDKNIAPYDPLGDYFAKDQIDLFNTIQNSTLELEFPVEQESDRLLNKIQAHGKLFSPKIIDNLEEIQGTTFKEIYNYLLSYVPKYYGQGREKCEGTKEVWTTEFVAPLAKTYPNRKFILVVRDPRAVAASKNVKEDKYPWLFLIRQWRKLAILTWVYNNRSDFKDRVLLVKYEELVKFPTDTAEQMCDFLNIKLDERILKPSNFVDGKGEKWLQNTSYKNKKASFNTDSVDKWKDVLQPKEIKFIEKLCFSEMNLFGYQFAEAKGLKLNNDLLLNPPFIKKNNLANWIQEYYKNRTKTSYLNELAKEEVRNQFILSSQDLLDNIDEQVLQEYFLKQQFLKEIRNNIVEGE